MIMTDAPGWYPDPLGHKWRYFDGVVWTRQTSVVAPEGARLLVDDHPFDEDDHLTEAQLLERGAVELAAPADEPEPDPEPELEWEPDPDPDWELDPVIPKVAPRPRHRARPNRTLRRRRLVALALAAVVVVGAVAVGVSLVGGSQGLDRRHAVLRYEGEVLGARGTVTKIVIDGDDSLQDRQASGQHGVSVIRDGATYACRLDADPALCVRSRGERAEAALRSAVALYLDPMASDGTFGPGAADAQAVDGRTVAGRASTCAVVTAGDRSQRYTVCRDAKLGFLTSATGPNLDLTLTSIRAPRGDEVSLPRGVDVEDGPSS